MKKRLLMSGFVFALGMAATGALFPSSASACGGFFCMNVPMDQAGEKIVFSFDGDLVTAVIQIQFAGEAKEFSWVLPLPSEPLQEGGMEIGSEELFTRLLQNTNPTFTVNWDTSNGCNPYWGQIMFDGAPNAGGAPEDDGQNGVQVLQIKDVGPFSAAVVKSDNPAALSAWLNENGYTQPPEAEELIAYYVAQENVFVALKLQQDKGAGDIAPISVTFKEPQGPCIPMVLTRIAATENMPVYAWILDSGRTIPKNYFHVTPNLAQVTWLDGGQNYVDLVTKAVDEAAGHGFVTDYAGSSEIMKEKLIWEGRFDNVETLKSYTNPAEYYWQMLSVGLPVNSQTQNLIRKYIPTPPDWTGSDQEFYCCLDQYSEYLATLNFDPVAFTDEIIEVIVKPIEKGQALLDSRPYLTRLFTTMSPNEMTRDPIFVVDSTLPDVSNQHVAQGVAECEPGENGSQTVTKVTLTLEDGTVVTYDGNWNVWDSPPNAEAMVGGAAADSQPSATEIASIGDDGKLTPVETELVPFTDQQLAFVDGAAAPAPGDNIQPVGNNLPGTTQQTKTSKGKSGCAATSGWSSVGGILVVLSLIVTVIRRRRAYLAKN